MTQDASCRRSIKKVVPRAPKCCSSDQNAWDLPKMALHSADTFSHLQFSVSIDISETIYSVIPNMAIMLVFGGRLFSMRAGTSLGTLA